MVKYVTTPIYYVNDVPHIGHAYTTILCDMFKRYQALKGNECLLLTGTDEHGQKIENSAKSRNKTPKEYADEVSFKFQNLWNKFDIAYDYFVRTTNEAHDSGVKKAFEEMYKNGDIYKGHYEGNYCISCETFFTKRQLIDNRFCPDCKKETSPLKEESYFFRLSKYEKKLLDWYKENPNIIMPLHKRNEVIKFIEGGLSDLSITRSGFKWGVSLPPFIDDNRHIMYVWLDALLSYITPLGYGNDIPNKMYLFNDATHFVGKDILRFHAIYWPAFLMSLNLPLPKQIYAHGWWTIEGVKMSKSIGNVVNPDDIVNAYGLEVMRYFLIREVPFGQDGDFSHKALVDRANSDLSDTLGNLVNRLLGMSEKYFDLNLESESFDYLKNEIEQVSQIIKSLESYMINMMPHKYLEELWKIFDIANVSITKYAPWEMMKSDKTDEVQALLVFISNILSKGALLLYPILPHTAREMMKCLKVDFSSYNKLIENDELLNKFSLTKIPPLFPKLEVQNISTAEEKSDLKDKVSIDQFSKLDIRVGRVIEALEVKNSNKLLMLKIDFGANVGVKQIVSGIAKYYSPNELQDMLVCAIINLKPTKLMGILSEGMVLSAEDSEGALRLISVDDIEAGSKVG